MRLLLALLTSMFVFCANARAEDSPEQFLQHLYAPYVKKAGQRDPPDQLEPNIYSARRKAQIKALRNACKGKDMCLPDFDYLINGQDWDLTALSVKRIDGGETTAHLDVRFKNFNTAQKFTFTLVKENGKWLIDQLEGGNTETHYTLDDVLEPNL